MFQGFTFRVSQFHITLESVNVNRETYFFFGFGDDPPLLFLPVVLALPP